MTPWMFSKEAVDARELAYRLRWSVESNIATAYVYAQALENYRNALLAGKTVQPPPQPNFLPTQPEVWQKHIADGTVNDIPGIDVWAEQRRVSRAY